MKKISAVSLSKGIAAGKVCSFENTKAVGFDYKKKEIEEELLLFDESIKHLKETISLISDENEKERSFKEAYTAICDDETVISEIKNQIRFGKSAQKSTEFVLDSYIKKISDSDDAYLKERSKDIIAFKDDIIAMFLQEDHNSVNEELSITKIYDEGIIAVDERISPLKILLDKDKKIKGIITKETGENDHLTIVAEAKGIPLLTGVNPNEFTDGEFVILDANEGYVLKNPDEESIKKYSKTDSNSNSSSLKINHIAVKYRDKVDIKCNVSSVEDFIFKNAAASDNGLFKSLQSNASCIEDDNVENCATGNLHGAYSGVGLLRLEMFYMQKDSFPSESELTAFFEEIYKNIQKEVTVRTIDLGGDKHLSYFDDSIFEGKRGLSLNLEMKEEFEKEIISLSKAKGEFRILFPIVEEYEDLKEAVNLVRKYSDTMQIGIMVETKKGVENLEKNLALCDFVSIGTNDLSADLLGKDRYSFFLGLNDDEKKLLLDTITGIIDISHSFGKSVCVCGEIAQNDEWVEKLIENKVDSISVRMYE